MSGDLLIVDDSFLLGAVTRMDELPCVTSRPVVAHLGYHRVPVHAG